ncbi:MAG TPA: ABC transporter permease [Ktedonobacterales bacterium]|nr:ABC transporter permease [Ktedonobacterales bacterium]
MRAHPLASGVNTNTSSGSSQVSPSAPLWALVSQSFATSTRLGVGSAFTMQLQDQATTVECRVGAIVAAFPTLYPQEDPAGFVVVALPDLIAAVSADAVGPNEFWLRDTAAQDATLLKNLQQHQNNILNLQSVLSRRQELAAALSDPLTAGLEGLLLLGASMAAALAILGAAAQILLVARQRATQFAVLRTLGLRVRDLTGILRGEQIIVYLFGLLGGTLVGALLTLATTPYLQFSDPSLDPAQVGVPPFTLTIPWALPVIFYLALLLACGTLLWLAGRLTAARGLGQALRIGED